MLMSRVLSRTVIAAVVAVGVEPHARLGIHGDRHALLLIPQDRDGDDVQGGDGNAGIAIKQAPRGSLATRDLTAEKTIQRARVLRRMGTNIPRP
jgi:hypothetical protein